MVRMAAEGLVVEFQKFNKNARHLRRLQRETIQSIEDVGLSGNLSEDQVAEIRLSEGEVRALRGVLGGPTCLVVWGQDACGKALVVTRLLGEQVLPIVPHAPTQPWRPIRLKHAQTRSVSLTLPDDAPPETEGAGYELALSLQAHQRPWGTVPRADVEVDLQTQQDPVVGSAVLEVGLNHPLLREGLQVVVAPSDSPDGSPLAFLGSLLPEVLPIVVYAISRDELSDQEVTELRELKKVHPTLPILFIRVPLLPETFSDDLPESEQHDILCNLRVLPSPARPDPHPENPNHALTPSPRPHPQPAPLQLYRVLCDTLGYLTRTPLPKKIRWRFVEQSYHVDSELVESFDSFGNVVPYMRMVLQSHLIYACTLLNQAHNRCMRKFILYAFDMAREIQITPRRISYAREKEAELYESLMDIASRKQDEIRNVIADTVASLKEDLLDKAAAYEFKDVEVLPQGDLVSSREVRQCTMQIQELVIGSLNAEIGRQLVDRVDVMRESYLGTLQRCLENLEKDCRACGEHPQIGDALKQMVNAAYQVEVTVTTSSSVLRSLWEKMKQIVATMPGRAPPVIDADWKRKVASDIIMSLSETRLTKSICAQFRERLKNSHDSFLGSLKVLEAQLTSRLVKTEGQQTRIKKVDAPKLARLSLESTSLRDMILFGMPRLDRELGRGQYGVVYSCEAWGGYRPCAVKSLVPLDEKHWNDLAMEFHYTRSVPEHDRIVALRGSVIDHTYGQGESPAVLLIMDRLTRDLYSAIKHGLDWLVRLQIALDVTQGIRFLHSQGLVHRDIKLKNVLLDKHNRAKLTDLGFCKPEAMMSGSIVGTPIHMAPELFTGHYDNSVDVYAFGILFWYICAGHVRLPLIFEQCHSKDQLWNCVKKGARPEKLPVFEEKCWDLMQECWDGDPAKRPLLGDVEPRLMEIMTVDSKRQEEEREKTKEQVAKDMLEDQNVQDCTIDSAIDATEQMGCLARDSLSHLGNSLQYISGTL
ncbi:dual serine/threonine and tyrosine protein kinase-like [Portunus trituberculatus]|uniref:dual serine/threonine and tyrosine protein kinase-like n=1 Tax=Portunus trituberculatus TaxID=210409 RepID=UPI001E1CB1A0|nr:dual serine/threonine and tyrosine protein kinase-like [Portunus trituberculatus]